MSIIQWLTDHGTNDILVGIWTNNWMLIALITAPIGAWVKGRWPGYWEKLATMLPFVGKTGRTL